MQNKFKPFISDDTVTPETTPRAIILGAIFGILFGAVTVYLALRAGLTVSASIPIAVLSIAVFKKLGNSTILENNIVQTIGSVGESVAAGVVFTIPAFLLLSHSKDYFNLLTTIILSTVGGIIGTLFMAPLRRALIIKEHDALPYPEGTACAQVLKAGEHGGIMASRVFTGLGIGILYKSLMNILGFWKDTIKYETLSNSRFPNASISAEINPEYLGLGYIIGPRTASVLIAGGFLSWLIFIPLLSTFIPDDTVIAALKAQTQEENQEALALWITNHSHAEWFYRAYVRYISIGAVVTAGLYALLRTIPTIIAALKEGFKNLRDLKAGISPSRTEQDIPITYVIISSLVLILIMMVLPQLSGTIMGKLLIGGLVVLFGFFFVMVSSFIVGLIGSSSNPISGMTIATLIPTCLIFIGIDWISESYQPIALCIGAVVCIAAANAGNSSQNLKTGYIVGATPIRQELSLIVGVIVSVVSIAVTIKILDTSIIGVEHAITSEKFPAPQATLIATVIKGALSGKLTEGAPLALVFVGICLSLTIALLGVHHSLLLLFAVGTYLSLSTTMPIFIGGLMKMLVGKLSNSKEEPEFSSGMLYSTGLVAGGSIIGILSELFSGIKRTPSESSLIGIVMFSMLCYLLVTVARKK